MVLRAVIVCWLVIQKVLYPACFIMFISDGFVRYRSGFFSLAKVSACCRISMVYGREVTTLLKTVSFGSLLCSASSSGVVSRG
ncbi:hypothetical protein D3C81_2203390 [compost metagenome]